MKTIEQAAKESSEKAGYNPKIAYDIVGKIVYECAFKAGVIFSQRWIPIEESMPEDHEELLLPKKGNNSEITKQVIVQYSDGTCAIDSRRNSGDTYNYWLVDHTGIIAWRPLELKL